MTIKFKTHIEIEVEIEFSYQAEEPQTYWDPGVPEDVEDVSIKIVENLENLASSFEIRDICLDHIDDMRREREIDHAERMAEEQYDHFNYQF